MLKFGLVGVVKDCQKQRLAWLKAVHLLSIESHVAWSTREEEEEEEEEQGNGRSGSLEELADATPPPPPPAAVDSEEVADVTAADVEALAGGGSGPLLAWAPRATAAGAALARERSMSSSMSSTVSSTVTADRARQPGKALPTRRRKSAKPAPTSPVEEDERTAVVSLAVEAPAAVRHVAGSSGGRDAPWGVGSSRRRAKAAEVESEEIWTARIEKVVDGLVGQAGGGRWDSRDGEGDLAAATG